MKSKGFSLLEVLIAGLMLAFLVGYVSYSMMSAKRATKRSLYQYVAMNIARDLMEAAAANYSHRNAFRYRYPGSTENTIPASFDCGVSGTHNTIGYAVKEWRCFAEPNLQTQWSPFFTLGDIQARGLVPSSNPQSVDIYYESGEDSDPDFSLSSGAPVFKQYLSISWEEDGVKHFQEYAAVPSAQVNNVLNLQIRNFTWQ